MAVITISREFGSGGDQVAARLCETLGYHAFGKAEIDKALEETTLSKWNAVDYNEDNHEVQRLLDRLFRRVASPVQTIAWAADPSIATRPERADVHDVAVMSIVKRAIKAAPRADNMLIVGRGGQVVLAGVPGVLHVRLIAPLEQRVQTVLEQLKREDPSLPEADLLRRAHQLVAERDLASADYIRRYFDVDWADPRLYHMVLNLGMLAQERAVQLILKGLG